MGANDPIMVNPKGIKVRVPEARVEELLKKGFRLANEQWLPQEEEKVFKETLNITKGVEIVEI